MLWAYLLIAFLEPRTDLAIGALRGAELPLSESPSLEFLPLIRFSLLSSLPLEKSFPCYGTNGVFILNVSPLLILSLFGILADLISMEG